MQSEELEGAPNTIRVSAVLAEGAQIEVQRGVLAVGRVDKDGEVCGIDFGGSEFQNDLLSVYCRHKTFSSAGPLPQDQSQNIALCRAAGWTGSNEGLCYRYGFESCVGWDRCAWRRELPKRNTCVRATWMGMRWRCRSGKRCLLGMIRRWLARTAGLASPSPTRLGTRALPRSLRSGMCLGRGDFWNGA